MKVSASFLSSRDLVKDLRALDLTDVDYIHLDIMDGKFVDNKTMPYSELKNIYKYTSKRLDVHLMVEDPEKYIPLYATLNTEYIVFHVEVDKDITKLLKMIKQYGIKAGLSIKPNTKVSELVPYLPYLDMVLVMSVEPGKGGQKFMDSVIPKINDLIKKRNKNKYNYVISIDGGINNETIDKVKNVDFVISGSYICMSDNYQERINKLR